MATSSGQHFGTKFVDAAQIFFRSKHSFGFVNLAPAVPGHVLVAPYERISRFTDLSEEVIADLWQSARTIGRVVERENNATSLTFAIQDGPDAGRTVDHVHVHVIPRKPGDFERNDDVYHEIDIAEKLEQLASAPPPTTADLLQQDRRLRTEEEMAAEAARLTALLAECSI
eukprot:CAMPEP_0177656794 /NCGR_PEP_ID=MMETSP0447-20121125/15787_1 /TAXON_ID=0 /ORGANISM="Stygamoeba regulata, Strain BSH-02190019" /LENGTH=170 /DNA_ID=CAMNT_0019160997 /DNA_START=46 /DNA_END=558 /DNA_ORIENTATION=+